MVKFCGMCGNLFNHAIDEKGKLTYYCQLCGHVDDVVERCLVINELNKSANDYQLNHNMIYDYTLPRTRQIKCPNVNCPSYERANNAEIIIFQYNPDMLTVGYMCTECKNYWKN